MHPLERPDWFNEPEPTTPAPRFPHDEAARKEYLKRLRQRRLSSLEQSCIKALLKHANKSQLVPLLRKQQTQRLGCGEPFLRFTTLTEHFPDFPVEWLFWHAGRLHQYTLGQLLTGFYRPGKQPHWLSYHEELEQAPGMRPGEGKPLVVIVGPFLGLPGRRVVIARQKQPPADGFSVRLGPGRWLYPFQQHLEELRRRWPSFDSQD